MTFDETLMGLIAKIILIFGLIGVPVLFASYWIGTESLRRWRDR